MTPVRSYTTLCGACAGTHHPVNVDGGGARACRPPGVRASPVQIDAPSKDPVPVAEFVAKSIVSVIHIVNVPVAPTNRPVPPTIVAFAVTIDTFGGMNRRRSRGRVTSVGRRKP